MIEKDIILLIWILGVILLNSGLQKTSLWWKPNIRRYREVYHIIERSLFWGIFRYLPMLTNWLVSSLLCDVHTFCLSNDDFGDECVDGARVRMSVVCYRHYVILSASSGVGNKDNLIVLESTKRFAVSHQTRATSSLDRLERLAATSCYAILNWFCKLKQPITYYFHYKNLYQDWKYNTREKGT